MSSRRERQRNLYKKPLQKHIPQKVERSAGGSIRNAHLPSEHRSRGVRTISPRALKTIVIAILLLLLLLLFSPKPPVPPGQEQTFTPQTNQNLNPIDLKNVQTTIPPMNSGESNNLGKTLQQKLQPK